MEALRGGRHHSIVEISDGSADQLDIIRHSTYGGLCRARHKAPFRAIVSIHDSFHIWFDAEVRYEDCGIVTNADRVTGWNWLAGLMVLPFK